MPKVEILNGYAAEVLAMPPSAVTEGQPGKTLVLVDKNSGDSIYYTVADDEASRIGALLMGMGTKNSDPESAVQVASPAEVAAINQAHGQKHRPAGKKRRR